MAEHDNGGGRGEVLDRPEDVGGPMEVETADQQPAEPPLGVGAAVAGGGDGVQGHEQEVGSEGDHRATVSDHRATEEAGATGLVVQPLDPSMAVEGSVVIGGGFGRDTGSSGAGGDGVDGDGTGPGETPPRDPAKGKGAREERERVIAASEIAARAERARAAEEEALRDAETEDRIGARVHGPRVTAVSEAESLTRAPFSVEGYRPPIPHLFVPSGLAAYRPRQAEYDPELILRGPDTHISSSWAEVNF
ncbi:B3 domain-containing protein Os03g0622100-like [Rhododendron vialii]|uniref:B3 domain-containing protein Os03g0622100-like n=1 Tax=Rhododendron vialii TaxID=182163 RepID=UPI00265F01FF|nr:B3 domain-containing protein Os03g0622100-like [Rhododendron vialii]